MLVKSRNELQPWHGAGHSLGGALVQVFAAALAHNHPEIAARVSGLYTYGMPRVGDEAFAQAMEKEYPDCAYRMTHAADIIPLVPPPFGSQPLILV